MDRLASWVHWVWGPDGAAAVLLMALHPDLDAARLRNRAPQEDVDDALELLQPLARSSEPVTPEQLRRLRASLETGKKDQDRDPEADQDRDREADQDRDREA